MPSSGNELTLSEESLLERLINKTADDSVSRWAKSIKGKPIDDAALANLRFEFAKALIAVAGGTALAFTGLATEAAAAHVGQKVQ